MTKNQSIHLAKRLIGLLILTCLLLLVGCSKNNTNQKQLSTNDESEPVSSKESQDEFKDEIKKTSKVVVRSIGDILIHDTVYYDAATEDGKYNFDKMFEPVKEYIQNADITTANLEVIAGSEAVGVSSYPFFSAPVEILDTLKNLGVDIVNNATNHTLDFGSQGAHASIKALQDRKIMYVGSYDSWDDYNSMRIIEKNGMKIGFLSYCYGTNGNPIPEGEEYLMTLIDTKLIPLEIERIQNQVDASIVMIHNGEEYEYYPVESQLKVNQVALDAGANFILGGHPHVLEPFFRENEAQGGLYSHGNFLSGQYQLDTKLGGISEYTFERDENGKVILGKIRFMPTYNFGLPETPNYLVIPLADWEKYDLWGGDEYFEMIKNRMTSYDPTVEVVEYLD